MGLVTVYCPFRRYDFSYLGVAHGPAEIVGRAERGDFMPPVCVCVCVCVCTQPCPTLCDLLNCSLPGSSVHGISQVKILEGVAFSCSWGSSRPRNQTCVSCIGRWILHHCATWECHQTTTLFISTNAKTYQTCQVAQ